MLAVAFNVNADIPRHDLVEVTPSQYGKYGITPIVGPSSMNSVQQITLIFNKTMHYKEIKSVVLQFFSTKSLLILSNESQFECDEDKCFIVIDITSDYQNNIEFKLIYGNQQSPEQITTYIVKHIGMLTGRLNNKR